MGNFTFAIVQFFENCAQQFALFLFSYVRDSFYLAAKKKVMRKVTCRFFFNHL